MAEIWCLDCDACCGTAEECQWKHTLGFASNYGGGAVVGGAAGIAPGAAMGAAAGAAAGSVVPVLGTVVGGAVGGLCGALGGVSVGMGVGAVGGALKWGMENDCPKCTHMGSRHYERIDGKSHIDCKHCGTSMVTTKKPGDEGWGLCVNCRDLKHSTTCKRCGRRYTTFAQKGEKNYRVCPDCR